MSKLLSRIESEAKKRELMESYSRLLHDQIMEFSRILAAS